MTKKFTKLKKKNFFDLIFFNKLCRFNLKDADIIGFLCLILILIGNFDYSNGSDIIRFHRAGDDSLIDDYNNRIDDNDEKIFGGDNIDSEAIATAFHDRIFLRDKSLSNSDLNLANSKFTIESTNRLKHSRSIENYNNHYLVTKQKHSEGIRRKLRSTSNNFISSLNNSTNNTQTSFDVKIDGIRVESSEKEPQFEDGVPILLMDTDVVIRTFGSGFTNLTVIAFTYEKNVYGGSCLLTATRLFSVDQDTVTDKTALFKIQLPKTNGNNLYICAKNDELDTSHNVTLTKPFVHQGSEPWLMLRSFEPFLPIWIGVLIIIICLLFSALFSGLNLGLMSLDRTELKILRNTGTESERKYAKEIQPVRDHGNFLLCSILLGNVLVNSTFTILLDSLTSGLFAVIGSTLAIVVFGEITPQAICSRHGLAVGAKTILITKGIMLITFPLAYPTSKILDWILGEEIGNVYNRERLKELVRVTTDVNDLDKNEVNIISGALELRKKTVGDVMTAIEDVFMLQVNAVLDFETVSEIMKSGFSRIPVYEGNRKNIVTLLYIKDLAFIDPDDNTPLRTLCEFYQNACYFVFEDQKLDVMFNQFKEGSVGHMAFVHRVNNEGDYDPFYETIGLVTLEDVIEELIQAEIVDETDVYVDNRSKKRRTKTKKQDFTIFAERRENQRTRISPQLTLATFQYLSTTVDAFKKDVVSETILRRLLNQDVINNIKCKGKDKDNPSLLIYQQGKAVDFFVLILEGRVEVTVGKENLVFESGPFTYFGTQALVPNVGLDSASHPQLQIKGSLQSLNIDSQLKHSFIPDYSVRAITDVIYIAIRRSLYLAAKRASLMEKSQKLSGESSSEIIDDDEVEKLLHSLGEDDQTGHSVAGHNQSFKVHHFSSNNPNKGTNKSGSQTPSPSVSIINLVRKKNQDGHKNDHIMYAKEPNEIFDNEPPTPTRSRSNSLQTSFNQHSASILGSKQTSNNSMAVIPNISSPTGPLSPNDFTSYAGGGSERIASICNSNSGGTGGGDDKESPEENVALLQQAYQNSNSKC